MSSAATFERIIYPAYEILDTFHTIPDLPSEVYLYWYWSGRIWWSDKLDTSKSIPL